MKQKGKSIYRCTLNTAYCNFIKFWYTYKVMTYHQQLKSILKASGWSQEELASRLNVSFVTLNTWINQRSVPRQKAQVAIELLYLDIVGVDSVDEAVLAQKKAEAAKAKLKLATIVEDKKVLDTLTLYLTYHTNTIEGSTMTLSDTEDVLFEHKVLSNRTQLEQAEARNHQAALLWLLEEVGQNNFSITEDFVRGLHLRLMNGILSDAGQYRRHSVRIMGSHVATTNYQKVPERMQELFAPKNASSSDTVANLAQLHAEFEKIHPFSDGNGRVGRLLMLAQAISNGVVPPIVLKEKRQAYYKYLEEAQTNQDYTTLELFIAEAILSARELLFE